MKARAVRSAALLLTAAAGAAIGVTVLSAWGALIAGPWVLPAIGVWVTGCVALPLVAWVRRSQGND